MIIKENQNIIDICIQQYGNLEQLFDLVNDNNLTLNSELSSGDEITIDETLIEDDFAGTVKFFSDNEQVVVTGGEETLFGDYNDDFNDDYFN